MYKKSSKKVVLVLAVISSIFFFISNFRSQNTTAAQEECTSDICVEVPDALTFSPQSNTNNATVSNLDIKNTSSNNKSIEIQSISITPSAANNYILQPYDNDFSQYNANSKNIGIALKNGAETIQDLSSGEYIFSQTVTAQSQISLELKGKSSAFTQPVNNEQIGSVILTIASVETETSIENCKYQELSKWNYIVDETSQTITLQSYQGTDRNIIICDTYTIGNKTYNTEIGSNSENATESTEYMFNASARAENKNIETITFGENVDTSQVTNMSYMFYGLNNIATIDLTSFSTSNVTNMDYMFSEMSNIKEIIVSANWDTTNVTSSNSMFLNDTQLSGQNNTAYNPAQTDAEYAKIDSKNAVKGYFTKRSFKLTFEANGGQHSQDINQEVPATAGEKEESILFSNIIPEKDGASFIGWSENKDDLTPTYAYSNGAFTPTSYSVNDYKYHTLYAIWSIDDLSVTFDYNDGSGEGNIIVFNTESTYLETTTISSKNENNEYKIQKNDNQKYANNQLDTQTSQIANANRLEIKINYETEQDKDWLCVIASYTDPITNQSECINAGGKYYSGTYINQTTPSHTESLTISSDTISFIFKANATNNSYGFWAEIVGKNVNRSIKEGYEYKTPSRTGYEFLGWSENKNSETPEYGSEFESLPLDIEGKTLYAIWEEKPIIAKAILNDAGLLTFVYDDQNYSTGEVYPTTDESNPKITAIYNMPANDTTTPNWAGSTSNPRSDITSVNFDSSFKDYTPTSTSKWFYNNRNLSEINHIENLTMDNVKNANRMFYYTGYNASTWSIGDLSNWNTESVTNMSNMFYNAGYHASTWSIGDLSNWNTNSVTNMSYMFYYTGYNASTWSIGNLSNWNTESVTNMSNMFYNAGYHASTWSIGDLSNWNTSSVTNMSYMFGSAGHSASTWSVGNLSSWNTSSVTNMSYMFSFAGYNASTWSIGDLSNWNTSSVIDMKTMFSFAGYNASTWSIGNLSNWNTESVTNMSNMFYNAGYHASTWSIGDLSNWNTKSVTDMSYMFSSAGYSASTWSVGNLSSWNTSSVTNMSYMFSSAGYSASTWSVGNLSNWNTSNVTDMSNMFSHTGHSSSFFSIDLSNWDTSKVTNMSRMFYSSNVKTICVGSKWTTNQVTSSNEMFGKSLIDPNLKITGGAGTTWSSSNPTDKTYARIDNPDNGEPGYFTGQRFAKAILTEDGNLDFIYDSRERNIGDDYTYTLSETESHTSTITHIYNVPSDAKNTTELLWTGPAENSHEDIKYVNFDSSFKDFTPISTSKWFYYDQYITEFTNTQNLNTSKITDMSRMFYRTGYDAISFNLDLSSWDTSTVTNMEYMFSSCAYNAANFQLDLSMWDMSNVTNINNMFYHAGHNTNNFELNVSSWNITNVTSMYGVFASAGFSSTTLYLDVSNINTSNITNMEETFMLMGRDSKTWTIYGLSSWDTSNVVNMSSMFDSAARDTTTFSLDLTSWDVSNVTNMHSMFYYTGTHSKSYNINLSSWNTTNVTDMKMMFSGAGNKTSSNPSINLCNWKTDNIIDISHMFYQTGIKTIYTCSDWNIPDTATDTDMFGKKENQASPRIVGGAGTTWSSSNPTDKTYARIDDPANDRPGYFTNITSFADSIDITVPDTQSQILLGITNLTYGIQDIEGFSEEEPQNIPENQNPNDEKNHPLNATIETHNKSHWIFFISIPISLFFIIIWKKKKNKDKEYVEEI